ncbi:hypothetical protein Avbf_16654 [Armadillidium vulgare]|nr:hypothetical protein Avbf_16654 [Armadillidium vulgare]
MLDFYGTFRGKCKECSCIEYVTENNSIKCAYCDHSPSKHEIKPVMPYLNGDDLGGTERKTIFNLLSVLTTIISDRRRKRRERLRRSNYNFDLSKEEILEILKFWMCVIEYNIMNSMLFLFTACARSRIDHEEEYLRYVRVLEISFVYKDYITLTY